MWIGYDNLTCGVSFSCRAAVYLTRGTKEECDAYG